MTGLAHGDGADELLQAGIASQYDRNAGRYDQAARFNALAAERLVAAVPAGDHAALLDVGSGTGFATLAAIRRFGHRHVTAVDISPEMAGRLGEKLAAEHPGLDAEVVVADVMDMRVPDGAFDLALCCMALHWFTDRPGAIARMVRAVRPGGIIALVAPGPGHDREYQELLRGMRPPVPPRMVEVFTAAQVMAGATRSALVAAGAEPLDVWVEHRDRLVPADVYMERITAVGSHVWGHLPEREQRELIDRVRHAVRGAQGPGGFAYTFTKTFAVARRDG